MYEIYNQNDIKDRLYMDMNNMERFKFYFYCEEQVMVCDGVKKQWDMIGYDDLYYYFIEIKTKNIEPFELDYLEYVGAKFNNFKPVKVVLISPSWNMKQKKEVSKYKNIIYHELDEFKFIPGKSHLSLPRKIKYVNEDYIIDALGLFSFLDSENFFYYVGQTVIENKYIILSFKFNTDLGVMIKYARSDFKNKKKPNGRLYYQVLYYESFTYSEVIKTYTYISCFKLNGLFSILKSMWYNQHRSRVITELYKLDKTSISEFSKYFKSINSKRQ